MSRKCWVCNNREAAHFFGLPKQPDIRGVWLDFIAREKKCDIKSIPIRVPIRALLCSEHFRPEDVGKKKLKSGSVTCIPTVSHPSSSADFRHPDDSLPSSPRRTLSSADIIQTGSLPIMCHESVSGSFNVIESESILCTSVLFNVPAEELECGYNSDMYTSIIEIDTGVREGIEFPFAHLGILVEDKTDGTNENCAVLDEMNDVDAYMYVNENVTNTQPLKDMVVMPVDNQTINAPNDFQSNVENNTTSNGRGSVKTQCEKVKPNCLSGRQSQLKHQSRSSRRKCAGYGCPGSPSNRYFKFPPTLISNNVQYANLERCKTWVKNCGNLALLSIETHQLHSKHFICSEHFKDNQFYNSDRKTLLPNANPTEFLCDSLSDVQMKQYPVLCDADVMARSYAYSPEVMFSDNQDDNRTANGDSSDISNNNVLDRLQLVFENDMHSMKWITCPKCKEKFFKPANSNAKCLHSINNCPMYTAENYMDPGDVPEELRLTYVEEQLIARVHPLISVFKLSGHHQYGYRGNIINFPQDVKSLAKSLPHRIEDLSSVITVRTRNDVNPVDFHVRADKVRAALLWLKHHNPYWHDIELSEENLARLPEDSNVLTK